jgi:SAM-dependent methyltransferase
VATNEPAAYSGTENLEVMAEAENYNRYLLSLITERLRPNDRVLDFGAGAGTFATRLHDAGARVVAVEPDAGLRHRLTALGIPTRPSLAEVGDGSIDLVYTLNVLEHIADDAAAAREIARVLSPGGCLVAYVPAFAILWTAMDDRVGHLRRYRRAGLVELLAAAGFRVTYAGYVDSLGFAASLAYRITRQVDGAINRRALRLYDRLIFPLSRVLDHLLSRVIGKNLLVVATKDKVPARQG